ncbi:MAG: hypothetical protein JW776_07120 [Candidatus Lokiarchaeota archaeon]|nr:hypothetical protein [Candidatus Lokiarchaeota archaeon]
MKKLPVCKTCLDTLCYSCQERYDQGYVTQFDMDLAKDLLDFEEGDFPELKTASFYNAIDVGDIVFLVVGIGDTIKFSPELLLKIQDLYLIPNIVIIEKSSVKEMIQELISPEILLGVNQIYLPTMESEYRINISDPEGAIRERGNIGSHRIPLESLEKACSLMIRGITKVSFS